jgi:hypothetical protein
LRVLYLVQIGDQLCIPEMDMDPNKVIDKSEAGHKVYLRVERQTLRRLPRSNAILFTIKTYLTRIEDVCHNDPSTAKRLAGAFRNWPAEMQRYKVGTSSVTCRFNGCLQLSILFLGRTSIQGGSFGIFGSVLNLNAFQQTSIVQFV